MRRGFLTHLLLTVLLLTQWVSGSRCVGGCQAVGQVSTPHVHLNAVLPRTLEPKGCGCQRQREVNVTEGSRIASDSFASATPAATEQAPGHDSGGDILYLSFDSAFGGRTSAECSGVHAGDDQAQQSAGLYAFERWADHLSSHFFSLFAATLPPEAKCPVYLRVRALLI